MLLITTLLFAALATVLIIHWYGDVLTYEQPVFTLGTIAIIGFALALLSFTVEIGGRLLIFFGMTIAQTCGGLLYYCTGRSEYLNSLPEPETILEPPPPPPPPTFELPDDLRTAHMMVVGGSGHGKSQLLQWLIAKDIEKPCTVIVIDITRGEFRVDLLSAIEINGKYTLLFIEIDRDTEGNRRKNPNAKGKRWEDSLYQYHELLDLNTKPFRKLFNVEHEALLLVATVTENKQEKILGIIEETHPKGCGYVLVKNFPEFGSIFHPPTELKVLEGEWARSNRPPFVFI